MHNADYVKEDISFLHSVYSIIYVPFVRLPVMVANSFAKLSDNILLWLRYSIISELIIKLQFEFYLILSSNAHDNIDCLL